jgi:hypothetical protein
VHAQHVHDVIHVLINFFVVETYVATSIERFLVSHTRLVFYLSIRATIVGQMIRISMQRRLKAYDRLNIGRIGVK